ncbi:neurotactin-like [Artemia franciscana]|uniref:Carboxylesterase type B domain-containing protein n=1 Tax=Artemia franciscana TaxID=6661 RepID=A0AA88HL91_ARTSF|nr:hypothetical protein QYM36_009755 [Artemia franciscana]KAK2713966.1 hypothetical protein QYM36_009755 [Artemia franciscana]
MNMSSFETLHYEMIPVRSHSNEYEIGTAATSSTAHLTSMSRSTRSKGSFSRSPKVNRGFSFWLNNNFGKIVLLLVFVILLLLGIIVLLQTVYRPSYENLRYLPEVTDRFVTTFTTCGPIEGINDDGVLSFRGIPYARPPIGGGRWKFAEPMNSLSSCWSGTFKAFNSSSSCWQRLSNGTVFGDEDCLTLDIYTPRVGYDSPLPVIVIVTSEDFEKDSTFLNSSLALEKNVVLVKVQFRLGVFGFLRASVLSNRVYPRTSGNYGLSDIVKALLWVKHNIEHFSGEPGLVTLLSHGAAATLVTNLINYRDRYHGLLFTQLWLTGGTEPFLGNRVEQGKINQEFLSKIDCEDIDCLLDKEPEDVLNSVPEKCFKHRIDIFEKPQFSWMVVDGVYIKETLRESLDKETFHDVTTVIGGNAQQHATLNLLRMLRWNNTYDVENYVAERLRMINATEVWARYNITGTPNYFRSYMTMVSELRTLCPLYFMAKELADHFHDKVYFYVSAMARAHLRDTTGPYADIRAILGTYEIKNTQDVKFVRNMQDLFYNFAWYGQLPSDQEMPGKFYIVDDHIQTTSRYPACLYFKTLGLYPKYARSD